MPTTQNFFSITFTDTLHGYIPVSNGPILESSDGGVNWQTVPTGTTNSLADICFPTASIGYSDGWAGVIVKTTDAGNTWSVINSPTTSVLRGILFLNPDTGFICGQSERIYRTTDGGTTWLQQNTGSWWLRQFSFPTKQTGYCAGDNLTIYKTTDGGLTWNLMPGSGGPNITDVQFLTVDTGYVCGYNGYMAKSFNGGVTWQVLNTGTTTNFEGLWFFNSKTGYCVGTPGIIMKTTDGGATWVQETSSTTVTLEKLYFINPNKGYICGFVGTLLENCLPAPGPVTGPTTVCQGDTGMTYSVNPVTGATGYQWHVPQGVIITSGSNTNSITVTYTSTSVSGSFFVSASNNYCNGSISSSLAVTVNVAPVPVITGNTSPLTGTAQTYSTETGKLNYLWTFSSGGTLISGGGFSNSTITIQWNTTGAQWVRVNYTDANGCKALTPTQLDILVFNPVTLDFTAPDTVCVGAPVNINNLTQGGTTFYWNFCSGNANNDPFATDIGNPQGTLNQPTYITLVKENADCFSFTTNQLWPGVSRHYHGSSFRNDPVSSVNFGSFGLLTLNRVEGIQVKNDNGNWYGFVNNDVNIVRLDFGATLWNTPTATTIPIAGMNLGHGLGIVKEGNNWLGFLVNAYGNTLFRLNFGISLANPNPAVLDFGNIGTLNHPNQLQIIEENGLWFIFTMNSGNNSLTRISFGNSLLNVPTAVNLGNVGGLNAPVGISIFQDCNSSTGYFTNWVNNGEIGKLTFNGGLTGTVTGNILGYMSTYNHPHSFSETFRENDSLFQYVTVSMSSNLLRLVFPPCTNASVPSSTLFNPPVYSYDSAGTYNIHLIVNEGMPDETSLCKQVVVKPLPVIDLGPDQSLCPGNTVTLNAGPGNNSYLWSTGATTQTIIVNAAGTYWANVTKNGCSARDTIVISYYTLNPLNLGADTTVCQGVTRTFDAGPCIGCTYQWGNITSGQPNIGSGQTYTTGIAGKYMVTTTDTHGCLNRDTVQLFVTPVDTVKITIVASENPFCAGHPVTFTATGTNGGTSPEYQWKVNGANVGINNTSFTYFPANNDLVSCRLTSHETCVTSNPAISNQILMIEVLNLPAGVSITATSNPFCPGSSVTFNAIPSNGGSTPSYLWKVNGNTVGTNSNTYTYNPANGDSVRCVMTSNLSCVTGNPASSAKIIMLGTLAPVVSFTPCFDTITRINAKPIKLKGGIPLGGTYSGPGVNSITGVFTPALAGIGTHTITYSYTNAALCTALAHSHIINYPLSIVNCGTPITDPRDNKVYPTVQIGSQCWLSSNLNYGTVIVSTQDQRDNCISEKYCYNNNPANCISQGGLYQWDELMQYDDTPGDQGFCPPAWHIPSENDWNILFANWTNNGFAGSPLKYSGYSGFIALLSGVRVGNRNWEFQGFATFFWSSTPWSSTKGWAHGINEPDRSVSLYPASRVNAFSVRCVKD
jgi:uncharacterized protein (TIGR02145 family)